LRDGELNWVEKMAPKSVLDKGTEVTSAEITRLKLLGGTESYRLGSSYSNIRTLSPFLKKSRSQRKLSIYTAKLVQSNNSVFGNEMLVANTSIFFPG
jgi:hypothetical protein